MATKKRPSAHSRGYDRPWERLRKMHLRKYPTCVVPGCGNRAVDVDHIVSVAVAPRRRLDPMNLQSLCHKHHSILTQAYDRGTVRGACDVDGMPLDPQHPWAQADNAAAIVAANMAPAAAPLVAARLKRNAALGRAR